MEKLTDEEFYSIWATLEDSGVKLDEDQSTALRTMIDIIIKERK